MRIIAYYIIGAAIGVALVFGLWWAFPDAIRAEREGGEQADARGIQRRREILEQDVELGLALGFVGRILALAQGAQNLGGDQVAAHVAGAAVAGGVLDAHALRAATVVSRELLLFDGHGVLGVAIHLRQAVGALRQLVAEALAQAHLPDALDHGPGVAEAQLLAAGIGLGDDAQLRELHGAGHGNPGRDGIETQLVADVVGLGNGGQVVYVLQLAKALSTRKIKVDIYTRWFDPSKRQIDPVSDYPDVRVIRIQAGPWKFIPKEQIYDILPALTQNII